MLEKSKVCLAVDIGGTNIKFALINSQALVSNEHSLPTKNFASYNVFIEAIVAEIKKASDQFQIIGVGIGAPNYNYINGAIENPPNLPWGTVHLKGDIQKLISIPIFMDKDAPLAALGEFFFAQMNNTSQEDLVVITLGTGIGSGIILHGQLYHSQSGIGSEAGHLIVSDQKRPCHCGGYDHLECYASVSAIREKATRVFNRDVSFTEFTRLFHEKDQRSIEIAREVSHFLSIGITHVVNLLGVKRIVLAGGGVSLGHEFLVMVQQDYQKHSFSHHKEVSISFSALPINHGALVGAAAMVFQSNLFTM